MESTFPCRVSCLCASLNSFSFHWPWTATSFNYANDIALQNGTQFIPCNRFLAFNVGRELGSDIISIKTSQKVSETLK